MRKIAIIGNGTAGCLTATHFNFFSPDTNIEWYHDTKILPLSVGEGSLPHLPKALSRDIGFDYLDLLSIDGTPKIGVDKYNWSNTDHYIQQSPMGEYALHFNASKLQKHIQDKLKDRSNVQVIEKNVNANNIDADYVIDCTGSPKDFNDYNISEYIPVNTAYVTQCFWDSPRFFTSLVVARPYGWVFGIPLRNRCAIGYVFNRNINSLEEIKQDVQNVFEQFNLTPSNTTNYLEFKNYYKKTNFTDKVCYNGNASFFLEPLEATSLAVSTQIKREAYDIIFNNKSPEESNNNIKNTICESEDIIMMHYLAGSKFKSAFWDYAQERGRKKLKQAFKQKRFREFYNNTKTKNDNGIYGIWSPGVLNQFITNLNMRETFDRILLDI
jgi:hypothetical protein